jgi:hypothetical protein
LSKLVAAPSTSRESGWKGRSEEGDETYTGDSYKLLERCAAERSEPKKWRKKEGVPNSDGVVCASSESEREVGESVSSALS